MFSRSTQKQWKIPKDLQRTLFPAETFTVSQLLEFRFPVQRMFTIFTQPDQYLSPDPIDCSQFDVTNIPTPPTSVIETLSHAIRTADKADKIQLIRCPHALTHSEKLYPLWLLTYWLELTHIRFIRERWNQAVQYLVKPNMKLRNGGLSEEKPKEVCQEIQALPWDSLINGFDDQGQLFQLHTYCSQDWLSSVHINHMLDLLKNDLGLTTDMSTSIQHTYFTQQVSAAYYYCHDSSSDSFHSRVRTE